MKYFPLKMPLTLEVLLEFPEFDYHLKGVFFYQRTWYFSKAVTYYNTLYFVINSQMCSVLSK